MKFKLGTAKLNAILSSVSKGVGNKYTLPITEYLKISLFDKTLSVTATNMINFITWTEHDVEGVDGVAVVKADTLIKLTQKTSKPEMFFELKDTHLEVKGNGTYKVPMFTFNEGESFPSYEFGDDVSHVQVDTHILKKVFKTNEAAIAKELIMPCLTGYNIGVQAITTDGIKMCINDVTFSEDPMLITQALADLIQTLIADKVIIQKDGNKLLFTTDTITIFGTELEGINDYPDISGVLGFEYGNYAHVSKSELSSALDRLMLFVDPFDNNGVHLTFTGEGLIVEDLKKNSQEIVHISEFDYQEEETKITLNITFLKDLLSVLSHPVIKIDFDAELPVKITENDVTLVLGTMTD